MRKRELGDWDALWHEAGMVFSPGAPIDESELFAGRVDQLRDLINAVTIQAEGPGAHPQAGCDGAAGAAGAAPGCDRGHDQGDGGAGAAVRTNRQR